MPAPATTVGIAAAVHTARPRLVLCDYDGCVSWAICYHSKPHAKVMAAPLRDERGRWTYNVVCDTCPHDLNATCQPWHGAGE